MRNLAKVIKQKKCNDWAVTIFSLVLTLFCIVTVPAVAGVSFDDSIRFNSSDGTQLAANVFIPEVTIVGQTFPAIIFINSWVMEEHEYLVQAAKFAEDGYVVLSYSARGWGQSTGLVKMAGPEDIQDLSAAVNWLQDNTPVDINNIGVSGISYGSVISLLGLAHEPRIKTAAAMSSFGSMKRALYEQDTPNLVMGNFLVDTGNLLARPDPIIASTFADVVANRNMSAAMAFADLRSPINYVNKINARQAPVYLSNNWDDTLCIPNSSMDFFSKLTGPKHIDLNEGMHAAAEAPGLVGLPNYVWDNVHSWFDFWLKGINNGMMSKPSVTMQIKQVSERVTFDSWPSTTIATKKFYLGPRGWWNLDLMGTLNSKTNSTSYTDSILSGFDTTATSGIPIITQLLSPLLPATVPIPTISPMNGIVYHSPWLSSALKLRGIPKLNIWVTPSLAQSELVVYLYDVNPLGIGTLITYGAASLHSAIPGYAIQLSIELHATAYNVPAGHQLVIAIDTSDPLFSAPTASSYSLKFPLSAGKQSVLTLQYVN